MQGRRRVRAVVAVLAVALVLTGCDDEDESIAAGGGGVEQSDDGTGDPAPSPSATPAGAPASEPGGEVTETPSPSPSPVAVEGCSPVGTWLLDSQAFLDSLVASVEGGAASGADVVHGGGEYVAVFRVDGSSTMTREGWVVEATTEDGTIVQTVTGQQSGTAAFAADGTVAFEETGGDVSTVVEFEQDGQRQPAPAGTFEFATDPTSGVADWDCTPGAPDVLRVTESSGVTQTWSRTG